MYGIYTCIYHKCKPHVSKYCIHEASVVYSSFCVDTIYIQSVQNTLSPFVFFSNAIATFLAAAMHRKRRQSGPRNDMNGQSNKQNPITFHGDMIPNTQSWQPLGPLPKVILFGLYVKSH